MVGKDLIFKDDEINLSVLPSVVDTPLYAPLNLVTSGPKTFPTQKCAIIAIILQSDITPGDFLLKFWKKGVS